MWGIVANSYLGRESHEKAIEVEADRVVLVERWHGGPGKINFYRLGSSGLESVSPLMLIRGIRLRREINEATRGNRSSAVTLQSEHSPELQKVAECLSEFFGLPVLSLDEAAQKHSVSMHFLLDSNRRLQITFMQLQRMVEIGPRVTLSKLVWGVQS